MAGSKKHKVVVIISDTLRRLGLECALHDVSEPILLDSFDSFDTFVTSTDDLYDVAFVESDLLALNGDYFISRRTKVIPIITNDEPESIISGEKDLHCIYTYWKYNKLIEKLRGTLIESRKILKNNDEKGLSIREEEVLKEVARGKTNKEIAECLNISMNTVMSHRKNITSKLNIKTVSGLTFYALINGLITGDELVEGAEE